MDCLGDFAHDVRTFVLGNNPRGSKERERQGTDRGYERDEE
jgi:hypothetical protein